MLSPKFSTFKELSKGYKMCGIAEEVPGDTETPITLFKKLCKHPNSYLLESVEGGEKRGRYSYIGREPFLVIKGYKDKVLITKEEEEMIKSGNPLEIVKSIMKEYKSPHLENQPDFSGGAVGTVAYDTVRNYENLPEENPDDVNIPTLHLLLTKEVIVYDHVKQSIIIIVNVETKGDPKKQYAAARDRIKVIGKEIKETLLPKETDEENTKKNMEYISNETKESYIEKVLKAKEYIKNGEIFQVVLSQRLQVKSNVSPFKVYRALRNISPAPYMFYINFGQYQVVGASPELLVKVKKRHVETCPIAGTRPRGQTIQEDDQLAKELLMDKKEKAEHLMLVDLARNDIGKVASFGSVKLKEYMKVYKYSHVMHIVSVVAGELANNKDLFDALIACFPAGTLSGAPKIRAMEIIDRLENIKRGLYGGAVGYFGFNGNMDMCIAIRALLIKDGTQYLQAGAGVVADSDPEKEYKETLRKLKGLMKTTEYA